MNTKKGYSICIMSDATSFYVFISDSIIIVEKNTKEQWRQFKGTIVANVQLSDTANHLLPSHQVLVEVAKNNLLL